MTNKKQRDADGDQLARSERLERDALKEQNAALLAQLERMVGWYVDNYRKNGGTTSNLPELDDARAAIRQAKAGAK